MVDQKVKEKIRKTMSLAQDKSYSQESWNAWNKARELLNKYGLTIDELYRDNVEIKPGREFPLPHNLIRGKVIKEKISIKKILSNLINVQEEPRCVLNIVPDQSVHSGKEIESILNTFHSMYEKLSDRFWNEKFKLIYKSQDTVSYRILYEEDKISFYLIVPKKYEKAVINSLNNVWPKTAINEIEDDMKFNPEKTDCAMLELRDHYYKATLVDRAQNAPIPSLMAAGRNIVDKDKAILDVMFIPVGNKWKTKAKEARNKSRRDIEVRKNPSSLVDFLFVAGDFISEQIIEKLLGFVDIMVGYDREKEMKKRRVYDDDEFMMFERMRGGREIKKFQSATEQKSEFNGFDVVVRIASESEQRQRANLTLRAIGTAFKDISADNEFDIKIMDRPKQFLNRLENYKPPLLRINGNIMSIPECSQLLQLPTLALQEEYPEIDRIDGLEIEADPRLTKGGMLLGEVAVKRKSQKIFQPVKNWDDFCRTMIIMGGQGQGKTKGFLANLLIEAYLNGFGALAIDAAKKEISEQIYYAVEKGIVKKEDFVHIDAGKIAMSLDWKEALLDFDDGKSRLASTAIDFFKLEQDTTGQTSRFLRALILCMKTGKLIELIELMEDVDMLEKAVKDLKGLPKKTITSFLQMSEDRRRQIVAPIYNRLDLIMGDSYLAKCLESSHEINMVDIMSQKKIFVFDFSDEDLLPSQQDVCINLLFTKIDLAMRMRKKIKGKKFETPFFVACDEPAKYLKSASIWEAMTVQGRKWRIGFAWAIHYWTQLPKGFQEAIKASLPHYFLYPTHKDQWKGFAEEIFPFTLENAMKLRAFHAINVIYTADGYLKPIVVKMAAPPTIRFKSEKV